ncbi:hypothetical protein ACO1O0_006417 [Amphichorda felina]
MVDRELQSRAAVLHDNARALDRQERDVVAATGALRRERERLGREADGAARRLKELGNVQNWAEVLERQFLVLEETDKVNAVGMMALDADGGVHTAWSDTSRSLNEPESSTGTGMAKGSETASVSTSS